MKLLLNLINLQRKIKFYWQWSRRSHVGNSNYKDKGGGIPGKITISNSWNLSKFFSFLFLFFFQKILTSCVSRQTSRIRWSYPPHSWNRQHGPVATTDTKIWFSSVTKKNYLIKLSDFSFMRISFHIHSKGRGDCKWRRWTTACGTHSPSIPYTNSNNFHRCSPSGVFPQEGSFKQRVGDAHKW